MRYLTPLGIRFVFIELHYQPVCCLLMMVLYTETCQEYFFENYFEIYPYGHKNQP